MLQTLDIYAGAGLTNVEIGATHPYRHGLEHALLQKRGFDLIIHSYFPPAPERIAVNLASQDVDILDRSRKQIKRSIDFCRRLGTGFFSFHSGFRAEPDEHYRFSGSQPRAPYDSAFATMVESVREIVSYARERGVRVAIENCGMPEKDLTDGRNMTYMLCEAWEFDRLWEAVSSRDLGMLLDLGHLKLASLTLGFDREEFISRVREKVLSIHVHDNDGRDDEHGEVTESSWCLDVLRTGGFSDVKVVTESRGLSVNGIVAQVRLLENALRR